MRGHRDPRKRGAQSTDSEAPDGSVQRHSESSSRDNRLLILHRKCPNPLACVHEAATTSQSLLPVPISVVGYSQMLCQPLSFKPRLVPVASLQDAAVIHTVGSVDRNPCTETPLLASLSAKHHRLRQKICPDKSQSAGVVGQRRLAGSKLNLQEKVQNIDIYVPSASHSADRKPALGVGKKLRDNLCRDVTTEMNDNAYYIDVVQCKGRLKIEHVENPRPLPPRHCVSTNDNIETFSSPRRRPHGRQGSVLNSRCVTDSAVRSSRHLLSDQTPDFLRSNSYDRPSFAPSPVTSCQHSCHRDSDRALCHCLEGLNQIPNNVGNSRTSCADGGTAHRCISRQNVSRSAAEKGRRQIKSCLKKTVSDVGIRVTHSNRHVHSRVFHEAASCDDSGECVDTYSIPDKYDVISSVLLAIEMF